MSCPAGVRVTALLIILTAASSFGGSAQAPPGVEALRARLTETIDEADAARLLGLLGEFDPPARIRGLDDLLSWQEAQGGGFYGLLPSPVPEDLPVSATLRQPLEAAVALAERRHEGRAALAKLGFPLGFTGRPIPPSPGQPPEGMRVELDASVLTGFVDALVDGRVSEDEAIALATLPANREMLRHRRELGYVPEPLPTEASLAAMIARAGSGDPLDRLWCWLNPESFFGYADVVDQLDAYRTMVSELRAHSHRLEVAAAARLAPYLPTGFTYHERFALTVGALVRGWTTAEMSGLDIEQLKDDWPRLLRTMSEEIYHRLQMRLVPTPGGGTPAAFEDLVPAFDDPACSKLFEAVLYTVLEGTANLAARPAEGVDHPDRAAEGSAVLGRIVEAVQRGELDRADELISGGLKGNGPLYALGFRLAGLVAAGDGCRAVPALLQQGPVALALRAQAVAPAGSKPLSQATERALERLGARVAAAGAG